MEKEMEYCSLYLPKEMANKLKSMFIDNHSHITDAKQFEVVNEIINTVRKDISADLEGLDDDILRFKGILTGYKSKYKEALSEHRDSVYKVFEYIDKEIPSIQNKATIAANTITREVAPSLKEALTIINDITKALECLNTYELTRMVELIDKINHMSDSDKEILVKIIEHKKEKK